MPRPRHLPLAQIPEADLKVFRAAYDQDDVFDLAGGAANHLAEGTRRLLLTAYRRWLGFLPQEELASPPADRITADAVRAYVDILRAEVRPTSVAMNVQALLQVARMTDRAQDWRWLAEIARRLNAFATPIDRFDKLIPGWMTLDYGIQLMETALILPVARQNSRITDYRDGLVLAILSTWPIRRRSLAALTINQHLEFDEGGVSILLHSQDTKSKRSESCRLHPQLVPYLKQYLGHIRPHFPGSGQHDGLWASWKGCPLGAGALYDVVRKHTGLAFGKSMGLHDFRRAAATFLATHAPQVVGLTPGVLQHAKPEVAEQHYNLARSIEASRRHATALQRMREELRLFQREVR